jgi:hypothetical protein
MACDRYQTWLIDKALGALTPQREAELCAHLLNCVSCCERLDREQKRIEVVERSLAQTLSGNPTADFETRLLARLPQENSPRKSRAIPWVPIGVAALAVPLVLALLVIVSFRRRVPGPAITTSNQLWVAGGGASSGFTHLALPSVSPKAKIQSPTSRRSVASNFHRGNLRRRKSHGLVERPDLRVIVEPGQWAAVVQLYDAVRAGRVNGAALLARDDRPINIKPIEISEIKIAPIDCARSERVSSGRGGPAKTNRPAKAKL